MAFNYKLIGQVKQAAATKKADWWNLGLFPPKSVQPSKPELHTSPTETSHPNINPVYPKVKFGPSGDVDQVVRSNPVPKTIPDFNPNYGSLQNIPNYSDRELGTPGKQTYQHANLIPSFGNVSKNITNDLFPGAGENTLDSLSDNFYMGRARSDFYKSLNDTLTEEAPVSKYGPDDNKSRRSQGLSYGNRSIRVDKPNLDPPSRSTYIRNATTNRNYDQFNESLKNMARFGVDNRISKPTEFRTSEDPGAGEARMGFATTPTEISPQQDQFSQKITVPYRVDRAGRPVTVFNNTNSPNSTLLHELEHTGQAVAPTHPRHLDLFNDDPKAIYEAEQRYLPDRHLANYEFPAVLSEIAHQAQAVYEATGKYPKGNLFGKTYEDIGRDAQEKGHVYGNIPMTEILKQPGMQSWLKEIVDKERFGRNTYEK